MSEHKYTTVDVTGSRNKKRVHEVVGGEGGDLAPSEHHKVEDFNFGNREKQGTCNVVGIDVKSLIYSDHKCFVEIQSFKNIMNAFFRLSNYI